MERQRHPVAAAVIMAAMALAGCASGPGAELEAGPGGEPSRFAGAAGTTEAPGGTASSSPAGTEVEPSPGPSTTAPSADGATGGDAPTTAAPTTTAPLIVTTTAAPTTTAPVIVTTTAAPTTTAPVRRQPVPYTGSLTAGQAELHQLVQAAIGHPVTLDANLMGIAAGGSGDASATDWSSPPNRWVFEVLGTQGMAACWAQRPAPVTATITHLGVAELPAGPPGGCKYAVAVARFTP